jgi:hypothetical protein
LERKAPPTFDVVIEQQDRQHLIIHRDVAETIDDILRGSPPVAEERRRDDEGHISSQRISIRPLESPAWGGGAGGSRAGGQYSPFRAAGTRPPSGMSNGHAAGGRLVAVSGRGNGSATPEGAKAGRNATAQLVEPIGPRAVEPASPVVEREVEPLQAIRVYPFGVSRERLEQAAKNLRVPIMISRDQQEADIIITLRNYYRKQPERLREAEQERKPIYILKNNTIEQMVECLGHLFDLDVTVEKEPGRGGAMDPTLEALQEAEDAINHVLTNGANAVELSPQNAYVRRLQHQVAERYNLPSRSRGKEPNRRVKIFRIES